MSLGYLRSTRYFLDVKCTSSCLRYSGTKMKFIFVICFCFWYIEHGFSEKIKKLPPGLDHLSYERHGPEDQFTPNFFTWVGNNKNVFSNIFFDHVSIDEDFRNTLLDFMALPQYDDTRCNGCIVSQCNSSIYHLSRLYHTHRVEKALKGQEKCNSIMG